MIAFRPTLAPATLAAMLTACLALPAMAAGVHSVTATSKTPAPGKLQVEHLAPHVDYMTVLPGERVPLRTMDGRGMPLGARWQASAGTIGQNERIAVWQAPLASGAYWLNATASENGHALTRQLAMIVTVPASNAKGGHLNGYPIGHYPKGFKAGASMVANRGSRQAYDVPLGFIELTRGTVGVPVSRHYNLGDFAGKDGWVNGRKYLFVEPRLVEKLECLHDLLDAEGYNPGKIQLMSAFRSPYLNAEIGNTTTLSRHTYGDAADMIVPDLNRDGRADATDARILMAAVTRLDTTSDLVGGASLYSPNGAHGYFIHTDARGHLVRW